MSAPIVFDVETKKSFREVNNDTKKLGVSVVAAYDYETNEIHAFLENELSGLFNLFEKASLLVGFNSESFDLVVLKEYYVGDLFKFPHFDILNDIKAVTGRRYPLDDLIHATLNKGKTGHGLQAIEFYREGKFKELTQYCKDDVLLTKELLDFGMEHGHVFIPTAMSKQKIPVKWKEIVKEKEHSADSQNLTLGF